jgi:hypothetical protein
MRIFLLHLLHAFLSPLYFIALPQGLWLKRNAVRMPEAKGPRSMSLGGDQATGLKLLYLGESPAAGVGIEDIENAVSAQVAYNWRRLKRSNCSYWHKMVLRFRSCC